MSSLTDKYTKNYSASEKRAFEKLVNDEMNFYDLKGNLIKGADKELKKIIKKAHGGLIDKPLPGGSRYI